MNANQKDVLLASAKALIAAIESDDDKKINCQFIELFKRFDSVAIDPSSPSITQLFSQLEICPKITMSHDITIPEINERLQYIAAITEEASHKTLVTTDEIFPLIDSIKQGMTEGKFPSKELATDMLMALNAVQQSCSSIMQAQEFQDLTGQVILQLSDLIEQIDNNNVHLMSIASQYNMPLQSHSRTKKTDSIQAEGPQINKENPNVMADQEDVDDLLSNLGI